MAIHKTSGVVLESAPTAAAGRKWRHWARLKRDPILLASVVIFTVIVVAAIAAPIIAPYSPTQTDLASVFVPPSSIHWLGTDDVGRDILSRTIFGARVSLVVGIVSVLCGAAVGIPIGFIAGVAGGVVDDVIMRVIDAVLSFPAILLAIAISAVLGGGIITAMVAIAVILVPTYARLVRSVALATKDLEFVQAARAVGAGQRRIIALHLWPATVPVLIVQVSLHIAYAVLIEASLSFLGLGVQPPTPSWGSMLGSAYAQLSLAPWAAISPGVAIFVTVLALNLLGDGLSEFLDPLLRRAV